MNDKGIDGGAQLEARRPEGEVIAVQPDIDDRFGDDIGALVERDGKADSPTRRRRARMIRLR